MPLKSEDRNYKLEHEIFYKLVDDMMAKGLKRSQAEYSTSALFDVHYKERFKPGMTVQETMEYYLKMVYDGYKLGTPPDIVKELFK